MAAPLPFTRPEYDRRLALVRRAMAKADLDVLFIEDPSNMAWITGYDGWSFYVHQGVLVFHDADPVWWGRHMDGFGARRTVWMDHDRIRPYGDEYVQSTLRHPMHDLAHKLIDLGYETARLGVEMENYYFSAKAYVELSKSLPDAEIADATALVNWQRAVKSTEELAFMDKAARLAEHIMDGVFARIEPGLNKNSLVADIYRDAIAGTDGIWGDYPAIVPLLPSGEDASAAHLTWDGAPFQRGEATFFELAGCYRRYHVPFCRTVHLGPPPDEMCRADAAMEAGIDAALEAARAGNVAGDVARALHGTLKKAGIDRTGRCGYAIGLSYPPDWGERTISFREEDETVLEPDMTFHFMPAVWTEKWGLETTESIRICADGPARAFCDRPRRMFVKD